MSVYTEEVLNRAARGLFDKIKDTFAKSDPLATSARQNTLDNANVSITYFLILLALTKEHH